MFSFSITGFSESTLQSEKILKYQSITSFYLIVMGLLPRTMLRAPNSTSKKREIQSQNALFRGWTVYTPVDFILH